VSAGSRLCVIVISVSPWPCGSNAIETTLFTPRGVRQLKLSTCGRSSCRYSPSITLVDSGNVIAIRSVPPGRGPIATSARPGAGQMNLARASALTQCS
jgi:hypothetical protein